MKEYRVLRLFRRSLYGVVLYFLLVLAFPIHEQVWGEPSLIPAMGFPERWTNKLFMFLHNDGNSQWYPLFFFLAFFGIVLHWKSRFVRLSALMVYLGVSILFNRAFLLLVGGNYLLHLLLFYLIFMNESSEYEGEPGLINRAFTRLGLWACRIQVIIVYLFSGAYKLMSEQWLSGSAVYDITRISEFTLPWFEDLTSDLSVLMMAVNYFSMAYFLGFPLLVWWKDAKLIILSLGVLMHMAMGLILGVMDFSIVMICSYIVFLTEDDLRKVSGLFTSRTKVYHS